LTILLALYQLHTKEESADLSKGGISSTGIMTVNFQDKQVLTKKRRDDLTDLLDRLVIAVIREQLDLLAVEA
jgi:hypothetical protein